MTKPKKQERRTKREREADELLRFADHFQNADFRDHIFPRGKTPIRIMDLFFSVEPGTRYDRSRDETASCLLSEVCWHRGHTIVNADGSPIEPVTSFTPVGGVRGEDGKERVFYGAVKRGKR
jgi:hypothetical protein